METFIPIPVLAPIRMDSVLYYIKWPENKICYIYYGRRLPERKHFQFSQ